VKPPVEKNQRIEIEIEGLTQQGMGVGRVEGYTLFVHGALPGERVRARVERVEKRYAYAKAVEILKASPERIEPPCGDFIRCGGCSLQHLSYPAQLEWKRRWVRDVFARIGGMDVDVAPVLGMDEPRYYRNKAVYPVRKGPDGEIRIGFFAPRSHRVVAVDDCTIQHPAAGQVVNAFKKWMEDAYIAPYDEGSGAGCVRHLMARVGAGTGEVQAVVVTNGELSASDKLVKALREAAPGLVSIVQNVNTRRDNVILGPECRTLWGRAWIEDILDGLRFRVGALSFYQVNPVQAVKLYRAAMERAGLTGTETVVDAYCGIGTLSLFAARDADRVIGVESVCEAVEDAKENAALNGIDNADFICAKVEEWLPEVVGDGLKPDVVIVDPPRKGCDSHLLDAILAAKPERVVYVSCDPATLARDVKRLAEGGTYEIDGAVQPVDMFCHSGHVECVIGMHRIDT
jgi:23S rRNA (uracil1939-C5)-methyltransferase